MTRLHEYEVVVPKAARLMADLPESVARARVYMAHDHPSGMPRSLRDLQGRAVAAQWASDDTLTIHVVWPPDGVLAQSLLDEGLAKLSLCLHTCEGGISGAYIEVVPAR